MKHSKRIPFWLSILIPCMANTTHAENTPDCAKQPDKAGQIACYEAQSSPFHPANQLAIPAQCRDPDGVFHPVRYLYSRESYQIDAYLLQPVEAEGGLLTHDFNRDGQADHVYLEREADKPVYLTHCMSSPTGYVRNMVDIGLEAFREPALSVTSQRVAQENDLLTIRTTTHAHNDGSDTLTQWYRWDATRQGFTLSKTRHQTYRGDGMMGDVDEEYDLQTLTYRQVMDCSRVAESFAESCQPYDRTGSFTPDDDGLLGQGKTQ